MIRRERMAVPAAVSTGVGRPMRAYLLKVLQYAILAVGALTMVVPFYEMYVGALRTTPEMIARPPVWIPGDPQWGVFRDVFKVLPMGMLFKNSGIVSVSITLSVALTAAMAGFSLAKYRFAGRDFVFRGILATLMFPVMLFIIPVYFIVRRFPLAGGNDIWGLGGSGLLQSHLALILPFVVSAWGIFLMRQFILTIPDELLDAARIDGCSELRVFAQIVLPQCKPALATLALITFIGSWNEYLWPMIVTTSSRHLMTLPVGIHLLRNYFDPLRNLAEQRAALAISVTPVLVLFLFLQRYYVRGIVLSGLKG